MDPIRILSTKKLLDPQRELLLNKGFRLVEADFIKIEYTDISATRFYPYIIVTSQNGVKSIEKNGLTAKLKESFFFCVGTKTAEAINRLGLHVSGTFLSAEELGNHLVIYENTKAFTYFCGNIRRKELPELLTQNNIVLEEVVAYKTLFSPQRINGMFDGVLFYSPSLVESYFFSNTLVNGTAFCIGETTATAALAYTQKIVTATKPTIENVIVQVVKYFEKV